MNSVSRRGGVVLGLYIGVMLLGVMLLGVMLLAGCDKPSRRTGSVVAAETLLEARQGFSTRLTRQSSEGTPPQEPPPGDIALVEYESPAGMLKAYLTTPPQDGQKHPAIVWVFGGFNNSIDGTAWGPAPAENDQSARSYRDRGIVTMYPSFRGGNDNPGYQEAFYGEVEDVVAAAMFLSEQDGIDPNRIYLGGHSTGGTVALLAAASTKGFRAVFALGPVDRVEGYGPDALPFNIRDQDELLYRNPIEWLDLIRSPTFVFEGTRNGNLDCLLAIQRKASGTPVRCFRVAGADHFSVIRPINALIAKKIMEDVGPTCNIAFTDAEVGQQYQQFGR